MLVFQRVLATTFVLMVKNSVVVSGSTAQWSSSHFRLVTRCLHADCQVEDMGIAQSRIHCASTCAKNSSCTGVTYNDTSKSCLGFPKDCVSSADPCDSPAVNTDLYDRNPCDHAGVWDPVMERCDCVGGMVGDTCERHPFRCGELTTYRYLPENKYDVKLDIYGNGSFLVRAVCQIGGRPTTRLMDSTGTGDHNRTWDDYVKGYYLDSNNWWIGLEALHELFKESQHELNFIISFSDDITSEFRNFALRYYNFSVGNASEGYAYTCGSYYLADTGPMGSWSVVDDLFEPYAGCPFSTADNDNDLDPDFNCASRAGSGWWYCGCNPDLGINVLGWSYTAITGQSPDANVAFPGLNMSDPLFARSFKVVNMIHVLH